MSRPVGSTNKIVHSLSCDVCGANYSAMHPSRRHCPRRCAVDGCERLNASGGYCKSHRFLVLDGTGVTKFSWYSAKVARVLTLYKTSQGNRCDICREVFDEATRGTWPVADHDHAHCDRHYGCLVCVRGLLHQACNVTGALTRTWTKEPTPAQAAYLADPPFQRWLAHADLPPLTGRVLAA